MNGKELAAALKNGEYVYGTAILSPSALWPKVVASLDIDLVFIDTEHVPLDREKVSWMCQVYGALNLAPIVRIPSPDPNQASMVLDGGATGIIAPYVETALQVRQLVGAVKLKPVKGSKLQHQLLEKQAFEPELADYIDQQNRQNVLIVNIESVPALEALDEILSVEGLDGILVGPHDLSCSLGIPEKYQHPLFIQTVETIIEKARKNNIGVGIHMWEEVGNDQEILWAKKGANLIMHSNDLTLFKNAMQKDLQRIKGALGESLVNQSADQWKI
ncbi:MAG: aldolase/citrate lyase family protein [Cyclobacteriaceae bacterium]